VDCGLFLAIEERGTLKLRCESCQGVVDSCNPEVGAGRFAVRDLSTPPPPLSDLLCARCGAVLPLVDSTEALLRKLTLWARFGLTSGGRPLLESRRKAS
jgi:hypothetical protein